MDASFRVEPIGDSVSIVIESRGGKPERNTEYAEGLELILQRLGDRGLRIADAVVDTRDTLTLPVEERRLQLAGRTYPVVIDDAEQVRRALGAAQAKIGRTPGARGSGNSTKRIRLLIEGNTLGATELAQLLEGP